VYQERQYPDLSEEGLLEQRVIGDHINPPVENSLMILSTTDLNHLLLLFTNGVVAPEILRIAKSKSNGNVRSYHEMKHLMVNVSGTTETLELSSF
jgi:hypothetical protein